MSREGRPTRDDIAAYLERFRTAFPAPPSAVTLGWDIVDIDIDAGTMTIDFLATDKMLNPGGKVQGGYLAAMIDDTMGPLLHLMSAGRRLPSTTDLHTQYHRPGSPGPMRCTAKVIRLGAQVGTASAELFDDNGKLLATATQTAVMMPFDPSKAVVGQPG